MNKLFAIALVFLTVTLTVHSQTFEGKIIYQNTLKSKLPNTTDQELTSIMGSTQDYIIKGGNYRSSTNGRVLIWQLYINRENRLYNKMSNSETILWNDGGHEPKTVLKIEINKGVIEILGYKCDEAILTTKGGVQRYYFNSKLGVDITLYSRHLFGNWYDYLKVAKAVPLKMVVETPQFILTSIATEIKEMKLDDTEFQLPKNSRTAKSPQ